jgi:hypothetical protein
MIQQMLDSSADLQALQEISPPAPVAYIPQTIGWLVILLLLVLALAAGGWRWLRRYRANRYRREALAALAQIEAHLNDAAALRELPALVKRVALSFAPREQVAALSGEQWLGFIDRTASDAGADLGPGLGPLLWHLAYSPAAVQETPLAEIEALCSFLRRWITHHVAV